MYFESGHLYHIYNQGNNRQKIFFNRDNYLFFLKKIKTYVTPFADILCWCLMTNHFHILVLVNDVSAKVEVNKTRGTTLSVSHQPRSATRSRTPGNPRETFQKSIGIMLASYTRAINKQNNTTGSLFRSKTKAECLTLPNGISPSFINSHQGTHINIDCSEKQYPQLCFNYIHQNPVRAGLVTKSIHYEFSSAMDYAGLRDGKLVNKSIAAEYVNIS